MVIKSILDNDLYKFTMQHAVIQKFPRAKVKYEFINRGKTKFPKGFSEELKNAVKNMELLRLIPIELNFLQKKCYYFPPTYFDFLSGYRYNSSEVEISQIEGNLSVIINGYWYRTILWEVPLMALISEIYFEMTGGKMLSECEIDNINKIKALKFKSLNIKFADFGTRRRYSFKNHLKVVSDMKKYCPDNFVGTSNVYLAFINDLTPIGTQAHEWYMFIAAKFGFKIANKIAMEVWIDVYRGDLGIALPDTFTSKAFFDSFDTKFAKLFDGVRHDSADPVNFTEKTIIHYERLKIDPKTKIIVYSNALNYEKIEIINEAYNGRIKKSYGIGTNLSNDVGVKPLNIVIKMAQVQQKGKNVDCIKLSDEEGKHAGNKDIIELAKKVLDIKLKQRSF